METIEEPEGTEELQKPTPEETQASSGAEKPEDYFPVDACGYPCGTGWGV